MHAEQLPVEISSWQYLPVFQHKQDTVFNHMLSKQTASPSSFLINSSCETHQWVGKRAWRRQQNIMQARVSCLCTRGPHKMYLSHGIQDCPLCTGYLKGQVVLGLKFRPRKIKTKLFKDLAQVFAYYRVARIYLISVRMMTRTWLPPWPSSAHAKTIPALFISLLGLICDQAVQKQCSNGWLFSWSDHYLLLAWVRRILPCS